jgi:hypothetical protein
MWQPIDANTGRPIDLKSADWPLVIHGKPIAGSSFFTITLVADLLRRGRRVVFFCAHGQAIRALQQELALPAPTTRAKKITSSVAAQLEDMQLVTFFRRPKMDMVQSLRSLRDWSDRIVVIKNAEEILTSALWEILRPHQNLILSGDMSTLKTTVDPQHFATTILFSDSPSTWTIQRHALPTYIGECHQKRGIRQVIVRQVA